LQSSAPIRSTAPKATAAGGAGAAKSTDHKKTASEKHKTAAVKVEESDSDSSDEDINSKKDLTNFRKEVVELHNKYRKTHSSPELKSNKELDILAQRWARKLSKMDKLVNSNDRFKNDTIGSNIAARSSNVTCDYAAKELVQYWYDAHDKYEFSVEPGAIENVGNFTQLVWKGSKEIGVGKHIHRDAKGSKAVVVCYYYPAGNIKTLFRENVSPKK